MTLVTGEQIRTFRENASEPYDGEKHMLLDIVETLTAALEHPEHTWVWQEPKDKAPVVDREGAIWQWASSEPDLEPDDRDWVRQVTTRRHNLVLGPSIGDEWDDVMQYAPIRLAGPADNLNQWMQIIEPVEQDESSGS